MTITISLPMIIYALVFTLLILFAIYRLKRMLDALGDLESYLLENNIWLSHFIPNIFLLIVIIIMIVYPFFR